MLMSRPKQRTSRACGRFRWVGVALLVVFSAPELAFAGHPPAAVREVRPEERRNILAMAPTRFLVPVLELRFERAPAEKWSWAAMAAYGGDQDSATFTEIGVIGVGARASYFVLGDRRLGVGVHAEARFERHTGINPRIFNDFFGFDFATGQAINATIDRLEAWTTIAAGGGGLFARASRRRLFVEATVGVGWQHKWTTLIQDTETANIERGSWWLPWSVWVGLWI